MAAEPAHQTPPRMNVDEFIAWALDRPGRYELVDGEVVGMSPQRARHAVTKAAAFFALHQAIRASSVPCRAMPDGMTVRISSETVYEPDALVYCGPPVEEEAVEVPEPVVVVEVLSPGTRQVDTGQKFSGYFSLPSVRHYLVIDPTKKIVIHHARGEGDLIQSRLVAEGLIRLDPPGIELRAADLLTLR